MQIENLSYYRNDFLRYGHILRFSVPKSVMNNCIHLFIIRCRKASITTNKLLQYISDPSSHPKIENCDQKIISFSYSDLNELKLKLNDLETIVKNYHLHITLIFNGVTQTSLSIEETKYIEDVLEQYKPIKFYIALPEIAQKLVSNNISSLLNVSDQIFQPFTLYHFVDYYFKYIIPMSSKLIYLGEFIYTESQHYYVDEQNRFCESSEFTFGKKQFYCFCKWVSPIFNIISFDLLKETTFLVGSSKIQSIIDLKKSEEVNVNSDIFDLLISQNVKKKARDIHFNTFIIPQDFESEFA